MFLDDIKLLNCIRCKNSELNILDNFLKMGDEIENGYLKCNKCSEVYVIKNGIPRFVDKEVLENPSWDFKWTQIDQGKCLNYKILDKNDPAYKIHDIFDRNSHEGKAFRFANGKLVLDIGCGVGQYSLKIAMEYSPAKVVSLDLTGGVDIARAYIKQNYPEIYKKMLFVQASVFNMPFKNESFDYIFSLGVLHHTGDTILAIQSAIDKLKNGGEINIWIYAASLVYTDTREKGREDKDDLIHLIRLIHNRIVYRSWYWLFSKLGNKGSLRVLRFFASDFWYSVCKIKYLNILPRAIMSVPKHPDKDYRLINLFDGFVNKWAENWSEPEIFEVLKANSIVIKGISKWRLGFWGKKMKGFYDEE